ncbi:hypothetical protein [Streptomyces sp. MAR4 CNX-425]|uniref:hypothetical protein n=1 Tax=Streptomyces sp. MAR4 CNX-425 TaxID=3406343 RepID=UPI003B508850
MSGLSILLLFVGLFLLGGVISFVKQGQSKNVIAVLAIGSAMALAAGILRLGVWD